MILHILLDSSPLGDLTRPTRSAEVAKLVDWTFDCLSAGHSIYLPEVIDYELRRELLRVDKKSSLVRLDLLKIQLEYLPLTTEAMLLAAELWADARRGGQPAGHPLKLDIDVILAAQALTLAVPHSQVVIATSNVAHLSRFVTAKLWTEIVPSTSSQSKHESSRTFSG